MARINQDQYYYCKKYEILCDEHGDTTSPYLERKIKKKNAEFENNFVFSSNLLTLAVYK